MEHGKIKIPIGFWIIAVFFLIWNIMGVFSFFAHTFISNEAMALLPDRERELYGAYSIWTSIVFAVAVFGGLLGSIGLLLKKKWAKLIFTISLCAIIPQMIHNVFFTKSIEVYGLGQATIMPIMIVIFGLFLVWYSYFATNKKWLQ